MRIWDLPVNVLCRKHLLGEHNELHIIWNVFTQNKKGWRNHPEVKRWEKHLPTLYLRHSQQVAEMKNRGYNHQSPLDIKSLNSADQKLSFPRSWQSIEKQTHILLVEKNCSGCTNRINSF